MIKNLPANSLQKGTKNNYTYLSFLLICLVILLLYMTRQKDFYYDSITFYNFSNQSI